jgi:hypothetical protein
MMTPIKHKCEPFDVFEFLKISRREDVLHAPMLAGLLDPFGPHGFNDLFLRKFVALVCAHVGESWLACDWIVKQQQRVPGGRVDILLLCRSTKTAVAIETKINAVESKSQLRSYREWLLSLAPHFTNHRLVFLTLRGIASRVLPDDCTPIGFASVLEMLRECVAARSSTEFEPAIQTYIELLARMLAIEATTPPPPQVQARRLSNLFRFLRISRREAVLHTRMIAGLLDPNASHHQGGKFLASFLRLVGQNIIATGELRDWDVKAEQKIPGGCLDILLKGPGILIAVENKIDAGEGPQQLARYAEWMESQKRDYPVQELIFLTTEGAAPITAANRQVRQLSYSQILQIIEASAAAVEPTAFTDVLDQYLEILRSIIPETSGPTLRTGHKLFPGSTHTSVVTNFLSDLVRRWDDLPVRGEARPPMLRSLIPRFTFDDKFGGKYSGTEVWHESMLSCDTRQVIIVRVELLLSNKRVMGLWVGLHWTNVISEHACARYLQLPEAMELMDLLRRFYSVQEPQRKGFWVGIAERLEYPRSDGALISILRHHADDLHRTIVSTICGIWALCGDELLVLNRRLVALQLG